LDHRLGHRCRRADDLVEGMKAVAERDAAGASIMNPVADIERDFAGTMQPLIGGTVHGRDSRFFGSLG
jgi:hypothetical protein